MPQGKGKRGGGSADIQSREGEKSGYHHRVVWVDGNVMLLKTTSVSRKKKEGTG